MQVCYGRAAKILNMKKSAHQIWKKAKEMNLNDEEFKLYLKANGVIVPKESIDRQHQIADNVMKRLKKSK